MEDSEVALQVFYRELLPVAEWQQGRKHKAASLKIPVGDEGCIIGSSLNFITDVQKLTFSITKCCV